MAASITATLSKGILAINAPNAGDRVYIMQKSGKLQIGAQYTNELLKINGTTSISQSSVSKITVKLAGDNSLVSMSIKTYERVTTPAVITCLGNHNQITAGSGDDYIDIGSGTDTTVSGNGGYDTFKHTFDPKNAVVNRATEDDVQQKGSPTCAFLSSLAAITRHNDQPEKGIVYKGKSGSSYLFQVPIYLNGLKKMTSVYFDGTWTSNDPQPHDPGEYWTILYQRAYLQAMNVNTSNHDALQWVTNGTTSTQTQIWKDSATVLKALTNLGTTARKANQTITDSDLKTLQNASDSGRRMVAGTKGTGAKTLFTDGSGLITNHDYTVHKVYLKAGTYYVELRNPWGIDSIDSNKNSVALDSKNDGVITITWASFKSHYNSYAVI